MVKKELVRWNVPVSKTMDAALEQAVAQDSHASKAEFVRDAVRRKLEELGFKPQVFVQTQQATQP